MVLSNKQKCDIMQAISLNANIFEACDFKSCKMQYLKLCRLNHRQSRAGAMQLLKSDAKSFGFCNLPNKKIEYYSKK